MNAFISDVEFFLPERIITNEQLCEQFPEWSPDKILLKTGISERHIAGEDECASDLAIQAATKIFESGICNPENIDFILYCTQSADYYLPTTACIIQEKLGIPNNAGALDFNLGCSGYIYGLGMAKGMIESNQARMVLLLTGETYSKYMHPKDRSVRTLFGDAGTATIIQSHNSPEICGPGYLDHFVYGTDGTGAENLIVKSGGARQRCGSNQMIEKDEFGNIHTDENLYMNGPEILNFTLQTIPKCMHKILSMANLNIEDIDLFVFHQANAFILENIRRMVKIPREKFWVAMRNCGNTTSSSIPIALHKAGMDGKLHKGNKILLLGFGVGYSWGGCIVEWGGN